MDTKDKSYYFDLKIAAVLTCLLILLCVADYMGNLKSYQFFSDLRLRLEMDFGNPGDRIGQIFLTNIIQFSFILFAYFGALFFRLNKFWKWNLMWHVIWSIVVFYYSGPIIALTMFYFVASLCIGVIVSGPGMCLAYYVRKQFSCLEKANKSFPVIWNSGKRELSIIFVLTFLIFIIHYQFKDLYLPYFQATLQGNISIPRTFLIYLSVYAWEQHLAIVILVVGCFLFRLKYYWGWFTLLIFSTALARVMGTIALPYSVAELAVLVLIIVSIYTSLVTPAALLVFWKREGQGQNDLFEIKKKHRIVVAFWFLINFFVVNMNLTPTFNPGIIVADLSKLGSDNFSRIVKESYMQKFVWDLDQTGVKHLDEKKLIQLSSEYMLGKSAGEIKTSFHEAGGQCDEADGGQSMKGEIVLQWKVNEYGFGFMPKDNLSFAETLPIPKAKLLYHFTISPEGNISSVAVQVIDVTANRQRYYKQFYY